MLREGNLLVLIFAVVSRFSLRPLIFLVSLSYSFVDIRSRLSLFSCLLFFLLHLGLRIPALMTQDMHHVKQCSEKQILALLSRQS